MAPRVDVGLCAVILAVTREEPLVLTLSLPPDAPAEGWTRPPPGGVLVDALPYGPLDPAGDRTLELALRRWVRTQAGLELGYVEQLYTFGDRMRNPGELTGGPRLVSVAYLALVRESGLARFENARWSRVYHFFPWEDRRGGEPPRVAELLLAPLQRWAGAAPGRAERLDIAWGRAGSSWDEERVLERYELLYEVGLVPEAHRDARRVGRPLPEASPGPVEVVGREMLFDHRRVLAAALGRLRAKIKYRPVIFELLPETFTLLQLQRTVEALAGVRLHKQNFRRLVERGGLVEGTGHYEVHTGGRPAELFRFRREVLRERPAPGVGLPGARRGY